MKIIVIDPTGIVVRIEKSMRDNSTLDYELVCEEMSGYIDNDCVVTIYHEDVFSV